LSPSVVIVCLLVRFLAFAANALLLIDCCASYST
jgi:hypothetical protein